MDEDDRRQVINLYEERFARLGEDVRTLGWASREDQRLRFDVLCSVADLSGRSVCDVGCGFGDLADYLEERFTGTTYTGVDIAPSLIARARQRRPTRAFLCQDILAPDFDTRADFFVSSGALSYRISDNMSFARTMMRRMYDLCERGVAVNFLTKYVNFEREHNFHYSPEELFAFSKTLTRWVRLVHDYPLWEFTLHLYRAPQPEGIRTTRF